jgi:acyl-CoA reductase-like NAD-dependent aldehyde dehydrogenase
VIVPAATAKSRATRLAVKKTYKLFIGGKFARSESGRVMTARSAKGADLDNYSHASRKDFRDAIVAARGAFDGWSKASAYLRGQILYRAAEMLENRRDELAGEIARSVDGSSVAARREVGAAIDRLVYFGGRCAG